MSNLKSKPYSSNLLAFERLLLMALGIYFIFLRPLLLPEDLRYMNTTRNVVQDKIPGFQIWLSNVFRVMGGYMITTGWLTIFVSLTSFRKRACGSFAVLALAGVTSIGAMTVINFIIGSDFKWLLFAFMLPWAIGLILYLFHK